MAYKKGHLAWNKGKKNPWTSEWNKKYKSEQMKGEGNPAKRPEVREKLKGKHFSETHLKNLSLALKGRIPWNKGLTKDTDERMRNSSLSHIGLKPTSGMGGKRHTEESKFKMSNSRKLLWLDEDYRERAIKNILKALRKRPTSLEQSMIEISQRNNLPYKYVGDGSFLIGHKNPDFIDINGKKVCIEVANTFRHNENYEQERTEYFAKFGWDCFVFRTNTLDEEQVLKRLGEVKVF